MDESNWIALFGLNQEQTKILVSIEVVLTQRDAESDAKHKAQKVEWLRRMQEKMRLDGLDPEQLYSEEELPEKILACDDGVNRIWFYLVMLEAVLFTPYYQLETVDAKETNVEETNGTENTKKREKAKKGDKSEHTKFQKLKYTPQTEYLENLASATGLMDSNYVKRFLKAYKDAFFHISGGAKNIAIAGLGVLAAAGVAAATAGAMAGPIAISLVGSNFVWHGAALTAASLALIGNTMIPLPIRFCT